MFISVRPRRSAQNWKDYNLLKLVLTKIFMHFSKTSGQLGNDLTRTSEVNPVCSSSAAGKPAFSSCAGDGGRKIRDLQRQISQGYLVNPVAVHWRTAICPCGD